MTGTISVNGESRPYADQTVRELLAACGIDPEHPGIAVAINAGVTPRAEWATKRLKPGDRVEVVQARAGG